VRVVVEADGGSRGNPGPAGYGAVVRSADDDSVLAERKEAIGVATNNVAEYRGLIAGLEAALELGADAVAVRMDSKLVVEQMSGRWQVKHPDMRPLARRASELRSQLGGQVSFEWIPRELNKHADRLANEAMDAAAGITRPVRSKPAAAQGDQGQTGDGWIPPGDERPTRLVLLRHGRTALNVSMAFAGRTDRPLDEFGQAQVVAAARRVARFQPIAALVSSPLLRTRQTASACAAELGWNDSRIEIDPGFIEADFGDWEALTMPEILAKWGDLVPAWQRDHEVAPPGGESFAAVSRRVRSARDRLLRTYPGQTVVVVTHVVPIKSLLRLALNADQTSFRRIHLDPATVSVIDYYSTGTTIVRTVNEGSFDLDGVATSPDPLPA
jgi:broad specificity phosphatase PhoE/ribonuclease HI